MEDLVRLRCLQKIGYNLQYNTLLVRELVRSRGLSLFSQTYYQKRVKINTLHGLFSSPK